MSKSVAILYQAQEPPLVDGIKKPMKPGGYSDSGADIAYSLKQQGIEVITPIESPAVETDLDWVFPDTKEGIKNAMEKGANVLWLNTVLFTGHPIEKAISEGISIVGQIPADAERFDDKWQTNLLLTKHHIPIPRSILITQDNYNDFSLSFPFPVVAKPIRGRGSQGVSIVNNESELISVIKNMFDSHRYGDALYLEEFLQGEEITITVMTPGDYVIGNKTVKKDKHWSLPPVKRFNHQDGIAPYNGTVAVINNSAVLTDEEIQDPAVQKAMLECEKAAAIVLAKAPARIDCRANDRGDFLLFDLNMKPNMTGASRPQRQDQDSLTALAARKIGWTFDDLILNMLNQSWHIS
ncbi:ATP-grasp domain-containing protein [Chryseobacterium sp. JAH]|uniref:ATP-grasp domain-containing protein n=1 Tax=Chryseobacterium sp. JAH TaxID=1742858 RepID=UPI000740E062|nr:ATP-grasp domain-containing protein [Chryseobacterium sp. JAH]KUJ52175.1 carboxylate--amine ligase [Chryseobacterium sp. JAH]